MEAAMEEFAERGVESASYNKIIERSGLSKGTVYYYFDNKDSLLLTVLDEICQRFRNAIGNLRLPETKEEYWAIALEYHNRAIRFFLEDPLLWRVLLWISNDHPHNGDVEAFHSRITCVLDDLLVRGQEIGAVRSDIPLGTAQRLMHSIGKVLSADMLERGGDGKSKNKSKNKETSAVFAPDSEEEQAKIEKFMLMIHDLSMRILTPEEDLKCLSHF
jgi:AcrR family transcriptional regulator